MVKLENTKNLVHVQHYISTFIDSIGNKIHYEYLLDFGTPYIKRVSYGGRSLFTDTYYYTNSNSCVFLLHW